MTATLLSPNGEEGSAVLRVASGTVPAGAVAGLPTPFGPRVATYLDNAGNRNGRLDVGDARATLLRRGLPSGPPGG